MSTNEGFFHNIHRNYGSNALRLVKSWITLDKKLASLRNRRIFLLQCRRENLIPNHIINNMRCLYSLKSENHPYNNKLDNMFNKFQRSILSMEIEITIHRLKKLESELNEVKNTTSNILSLYDFTNFSNSCVNNYKKLFNVIKLKNIKTLTQIKDKRAVFQIGTHEKFLYNFSDLELPPEVKRVLSAGPKFALPSGNNIPIPTIIKDLEYCIDSFFSDGEAKNDIRATSVNILTNYNNYMKNHTLNRNDTFIRDFTICRTFLENHPEILVMRSDKGNSTVIMLKDEYAEGMNKLLSDDLVYKKLRSDPTTKYQNQANNFIKELQRLGHIDENHCKRLKTFNSVSPKLYGLRKTHKQSLSLRPVVSCNNSPSYNLATFIHNILNPLTSTFKYNVKNSFEFVEFTKTVELPESHALVSLDVVSLYTNIPKQLVLHIIKKNWQFISAYTSIPRDLLCNMIEFLFTSSYFSFNDQIYQQLDGSAMGNPASPILANLVMNELITDVEKQLPFKLPFIKLYVDDTVLACPVDQVEHLLEHFNNFHKKIQFTIEKEIDKKIPFLDTIVIRDSDGHLKTNWYTKPTASGRVLNFFSSHATVHKINTIKNLLHRANKLSSTEFQKENEIKVKNILKNNNYPITLVNRIITKYKNPSENKKDSERVIKYCRFPFIKGLSHKIERNITGKAPECKLAFYNTKTTSSLFSKLKDKTPNELRSNLVYKIPCLNCEKCYVGTTKQYLKARVNQHKYDCREYNREKNEKTALSSHHFNTGHNFNFSNTSILDSEEVYRKRCISEMIQISLNNTVNHRTDIQGLSIQYNHLLNQYKNKTMAIT